MSDTLVFDMSSASEGSPSVFVRKDWLSILDNMNRNYQGNQCIIDTSQLANSNKYMSYREAYLQVPLVITGTSGALFTANPSKDFVVGMKNWYGSIIHSFSLDYNGTTIVQQTPFIGMWNCFKLMTSLSQDDLITQGPSIGFYPDNVMSWAYSTSQAFVGGVPQANSTAGLAGVGLCNNNVSPLVSVAQVQGENYGQIMNGGLLKRQMYWNWDPNAQNGFLWSNRAQENSAIFSAVNLSQVYKSNIYNATTSVFQVGILAQIYLKQLHSFFERTPLLKGVFMKLILNLNQTSVSITATNTPGATPPSTSTSTLTCTNVNSPLGGVSPLMITSGNLDGGSSTLATGAYVFSIAVGATCISSLQTGVAGLQANPIGGGSVQLVIPAYTFNPVFETSMLSSPIKKIVYEDVYQYTINNVLSNAPFTYLITNGIANVKSVLVLPYYTASTNYVGATTTCPPFQSPFDPAGCGPTSPLCLFSNFNVQVSGQNAIYNTQRYTYEQFTNQLYGCNAVNGGMTDGLTSGLVGFKDFEMGYCYYYVNVGRMLPIEEAVPKAINLIGINMAALAIDMYVFISYGVEVSIDILSGARV